MRKLWLILALLGVAAGFKFSDVAFLKTATVEEVSGETFDLEEGFEGAGYENAVWTVYGSSPDPDYTGEGKIDGSQSCYIDGGSDEILSNTNLVESAMTVAFKIRWDTLPASLPSQTAKMRAASEADVCLFRVETGNVITIRTGSSGGGSTVATISADTTYWVWFSYQAGGGANSKCKFAFSTTGTKPTSGDYVVEQTDGDATLNAYEFMFWAAGTDHDIIVDSYRRKTGYDSIGT